MWLARCSRLQLPGQTLRWFELMPSMMKDPCLWYRFAKQHARVWYAAKTVSRSVRHVSGPVNPPPDGVVALLLVRDGAVWLEEFLNYHIGIGVCHFIVMDNGSQDDTIDIASRYQNVTTVSCELDFRQYEQVMRYWMQRRYCQNRWALSLDVDELFDYPGSGTITIDALAGYLDAHGYDAVLSVFLDMYPESLPAPGNRLDLEATGFFEIDTITKHPYTPFGVTFDETYAFEARNGMRARVFGLDGTFLIKHALRKDCGQIWYPRTNNHRIYGIKLADFSTVLRHYKWVPGFEEYVEASVIENNHWSDSHDYRHYQDTLVGTDRLQLHYEGTQKYQSADQLLDLGLLEASAGYRRFIRRGSTSV